MSPDLSAMRKSYQQDSLSETTVLGDPVAQFSAWFAEANARNSHEANAMVLSTVDATGIPSSRVVLLKGFDASGFVFYSSYASQKGQEIAANPNVALAFYWPSFERQVRVTGIASQISPEQSDAYFATRPHGSQVSAIASPQSDPISDRAWLEQRAHAVGEDTDEAPLSRPADWGGYCVMPSRIEFWQGRPDRLHDRLLFVRSGDEWALQRLAP